MAQNWCGLFNTGLTELTGHKTYNMNFASPIKAYKNQIKHFITYMPDSNGTVSATTSINFQDCYKASDGKGYAHASFGFNTPGYIAAFPIVFGFVSVDKSGTLRVIGQKQVLTNNPSSAQTQWDTTFETSFTWPTSPRGIVPFIGVGGHPCGQRFYYTDKSGTIYCYTTYNNTTKSSYSGTVPNISSARTGAADFAANAWNQSETGIKANVVCPFIFNDWYDKATSTFIGGWRKRGTSTVGKDGYQNHYIGVGFVFCGDSYTAIPTYSNSAMQIGMKVYVYTSSGKPVQAKNVYVYNSSGKPVQAKAMYVYNSSGKPVQVF